MNMRERMLAVIRRGRLDRVPFVQYDNTAGPNETIWNVIGRDNMGLLRWCAAHRFEHPNCRFESEQITRNGQPGWRNTLVTPAGNLQEDKLLVPNMGGVTGFAKHYVQNAEDYDVLIAYLDDITVVEDATSVRQAVDELGDDGLPHAHIGRTPFQQLWTQWVSIMDLSMHMVDAPQLVGRCMELMGAILLQVAEVTALAARDVEIPYIVIGDNITAAMIGEERFREYCVSWYNAVAARTAGQDIPLYVHMDGDLKPLGDAIRESAVSGLDSFTPLPDNDLTVADALSTWPDIRLLVNFPSSVHLADSETIHDQAKQILAEGGHSGRMQIQISENTPPEAWRRSFPQIVRAIDEFGSP